MQAQQCQDIIFNPSSYEDIVKMQNLCESLSKLLGPDYIKKCQKAVSAKDGHVAASVGFGVAAGFGAAPLVMASVAEALKANCSIRPCLAAFIRASMKAGLLQDRPGEGSKIYSAAEIDRMNDIELNETCKRVVQEEKSLELARDFAVVKTEDELFAAGVLKIVGAVWGAGSGDFGAEFPPEFQDVLDTMQEVHESIGLRNPFLDGLTGDVPGGVDAYKKIVKAFINPKGVKSAAPGKKAFIVKAMAYRINRLSSRANANSAKAKAKATART